MSQPPKTHARRLHWGLGEESRPLIECPCIKLILVRSSSRGAISVILNINFTPSHSPSTLDPSSLFIIHRHPLANISQHSAIINSKFKAYIRACILLRRQVELRGTSVRRNMIELNRRWSAPKINIAECLSHFSEALPQNVEVMNPASLVLTASILVDNPSSFNNAVSEAFARISEGTNSTLIIHPLSSVWSMAAMRGSYYEKEPRLGDAQGLVLTTGNRRLPALF
jgi:hypothetical protein